MGSMFRTSDAAGVEKIYLCGITPTPVDEFGRVNKDIAKTALGAERYVKWEKVGSAPHQNQSASWRISTGQASSAVANPKSIGKLIDKLRKEGYEVLAMEQSKGSIPYYEYRPHLRTSSQPHPNPLLEKGEGSRFSPPLIKGKKEEGLNKIALIVGNEVKGLPKSILKKVDKILEIPMYGRKESLNVSVAFGVVVFGIRHAK